MKTHELFGNKYSIWWGILMLVCIIWFYVFGLPQEKGYEGYGIF